MGRFEEEVWWGVNGRGRMYGDVQDLGSGRGLRREDGGIWGEEKIFVGSKRGRVRGLGEGKE